MDSSFLLDEEAYYSALESGSEKINVSGVYLVLVLIKRLWSETSVTLKKAVESGNVTLRDARVVYVCSAKLAYAD